MGGGGGGEERLLSCQLDRATGRSNLFLHPLCHSSLGCCFPHGFPSPPPLPYPLPSLRCHCLLWIHALSLPGHPLSSHLTYPSSSPHLSPFLFISLLIASSPSFQFVHFPRISLFISFPLHPSPPLLVASLSSYLFHFTPHLPFSSLSSYLLLHFITHSHL